MKIIISTILTAAALTMTTGCATQRGFPARDQIANFSQVDEVFFRGAQPPYSSFKDLAALGVRAVVNLREPGDGPPAEEAFVTQAGMKYVPLPMSGVIAPSDADLNHILAAIEAAPKPVFVHCQFGCDRTGIVTGAWRIRHNNWTPQKAVQEAKAFGASPLLPNFKLRLEHFK